MSTVLMDNEWLSVTLPDGFEEIPHTELEAFVGFKYDLLQGVRDTDRHMMLAVTWKDSGKVLSKLGSAKLVAEQVEKTNKKRYGKNGYKQGERFEHDVAGASGKAHGFRFTLTADGVPQDGEYTVFKRGGRCYTLMYWTWSSVADANRATYEAIVDSLEVR